ncbi:tetratricopeptide repeat protein [Streptomyces sp.]|uniref:tetratricopeptide repeat protein n=1 Tax=Streptomyces sp. TaxID=1931 RepID=UPI00281110D8|nr:tetratricopeptide repeat protein [Streptomyces sp.]
MAQARPSMQELIQRRRRGGLVARSAERELFRANFDTPPEDGRHRFLFHVHGNAGVGKTRLLKEFEHIARERGAVTAYVDESAGSVPEALAVMCRQFAAQGHRFKELDRLLAAHRERRHEAEVAALAALEPEPDSGPSAGGMAVARAGLAGLGLLPGVGAFAGVLDPTQLAQGADRLRTGLSARFRSHEDVQLVLSPESVLTPVLANELHGAASAAPWIVLFFDTYERTGTFLDAWLHDVMTTERYGALPATVVVVTAGQRPVDTARWGGCADSVTALPLGPFTEAEARGLLADRGITAEPVVAEVLRLTGGLPVLVSTLAGTRPARPDDVHDPSATAVERFLKWEPDPVRRAAALAGALPRWLDADVFRVAADCGEDRLDELYGWVSTLPFADERAGRLRYHDVVRAPMLRLQRGRSPRGWAQRHRRLAEVFRQWREESEAGRDAGELWADGEWQELRLAESYHRLCAREREALPGVLRDLVEACDRGEPAAGRWVRVLEDAGRDTGLHVVAEWGRRLSDALTANGTEAVLSTLLVRAGYVPATRGGLGACRMAAPRPALDAAPGENADGYGDEPGWNDVELPPEVAARALRSRAAARAVRGEYATATTVMSQALGLVPDDALSLALRGEYLRIQRHHHWAVRDLERAVALDPALGYAWASLGATRLARGDLTAALDALDRALALRPDYPWALIRRARVSRELGDHARQLADLDRAVALQPDSPWAHCERGDALRAAGRDEEALAAYDHALALDTAYASAYASRGASLANLGRHPEALADLDRALGLNPSYAWARAQREAVERHLDQVTDAGG